jgi:hypothetical protein
LKLGEEKLEAMNQQIRSSIELRDELKQALGQIRAGLNAPPKSVQAAKMTVTAAKAR